ncbi:Reverse transcriptase (RNA-dependent DNA polymerase) [Nesidiocoris tenuis]|nr:Reverse transcriptase (RNA-dependent DNA polymerase) [Nesidiocoris tenuis]
MGKEGVGVALIQEPYLYGGRIRGFGAAAKVVTKEQNPWAAVVINDEKLRYVAMQQFLTGTTAAIRVNIRQDEVLLASQYCKIHEDIELDVERLRKIFEEGGKVLVGVDTNAHSAWWHSADTNDRGISVERFLMAGNVDIANRQMPYTTFSAHAGGETNIEVTFVTPALTRHITWDLEEDPMGDHRPILVACDFDRHEREASSKIFCYKTANWKRYNERLGLRLADMGSLESAAAINRAVKKWNKAIKETNKEILTQIPVKKGMTPCPWWDGDVEKLRLEYHKRRHEHQRLDAGKENAKRIMVQTRRKYKKICKAKKRTSWKAFINSEVARDPWGFLYKQAAGKLKAKSGLSTVLTESQEYTTRWWDTAGEYLRVLLMQDDPARDDVEQRHMRKICTWVTTEMVGKIEAPFTNGETAAALRTLKTGKAPGPNGHKAEVITNLSDQNHQRMQSIYNASLEIGHFPEPWMEGIAVVLYKGNEKSIHEPSSHRIIQLLDVHGGAQGLVFGIASTTERTG